jgi:two-component system, sporulation sensor kinase C
VPKPTQAHLPVDRAWDVLDAVPAGVMWFAANGRVIFLNRALCRMAGVLATDVLGRSLAELRAQFHWEEEDPSARFRDSDGREVLRVHVPRADGSGVWLQVAVEPLHTTTGAPDGVLALVLDVTHQRDLEARLRSDAERLEVAERSARLQVLEARRLQNERLAALGQLAAGVAHEINNPLAGIKNALLLVRDAVPRDHPDRVYLDMMDKEIDRIGTIVRRLYEVYRPEAGQGRPVEIQRVLEEARRAIATVLAEHDVTLAVEIAANLPALVIPPEQLLEILEHILRNAVEASKRGGVVKVTVSASASVVSITIADQGEGIPDAVLPAIFDPFFTTKTVEQGLRGMGLGLSVSRSLVEALGGRLYVQTRAGHGSTFTVVLPRDQGAPGGARAVAG